MKSQTFAFRFFTLAACLAVTLAASPYLNQKPPFLPKSCKLMTDAAKQDQCTTDLGKHLFGTIITGAPEIQIPPLDPLNIEEINLASGDGPVKLDLILTSVIVYGLKNLDVKNLGVSKAGDNYNWHLEATAPHLVINGTYKADGKVLIVPIRGHGPCHIDAKQVFVNATIQMKTVNTNKRTFFNLDAIHVDFDMTDLFLNLDNLFEGQTELGKSTNEYLQQNWRDVKIALAPALSETIGAVIEVYLGALLKKVPAEYIIEDVPK